MTGLPAPPSTPHAAHAPDPEVRQASICCSAWSPAELEPFGQALAHAESTLPSGPMAQASTHERYATHSGLLLQAEILAAQACRRGRSCSCS